MHSVSQNYSLVTYNIMLSNVEDYTHYRDSQTESTVYIVVAYHQVVLLCSLYNF